MLEDNSKYTMAVPLKGPCLCECPEPNLLLSPINIIPK